MTSRHREAEIALLNEVARWEVRWEIERSGKHDKLVLYGPDGTRRKFPFTGTATVYRTLMNHKAQLRGVLRGMGCQQKTR